MDEVHARVEGSVGRLTLSRPKALNALTGPMLVKIGFALRGWAGNPSVAMVLIEGDGGRAFCAGGDVAETWRDAQAGDPSSGPRFFADEYRLNALVKRFPKPWVALMDGIVMGGGVGISAHGSHRIVTERSTVAMPECAIGLIPDVGSTMILAQAPGHAGEYLAMTGARMDAADAIHAGFADLQVPSERLPELAAALVEAGEPGVIRDFAVAPGWSALAACQAQIDHCFAGETALDIVARLEDDRSEWAADALTAIRRASPLSVAAALETVRALRADPAIETALRTEYRFTSRAVRDGDFMEGVRAALIDKDRMPRWSPERLEDLPHERVEAMLAPLGPDELFLDHG
ncbi:enoyl-CoA hydratase/isomerase family protein [Mangrovibrevibacter kandeliae]|uniref:enoyl-CoA hydratase/isomerase family protein n=1 Tax=Mangrovibrevibacter kandeliae TaxID=2968473 RepID=UPI002118918C|nr:enoyl-CoA hydratase/isomerase family protein [Aurantimonas sp. CSK15Z-1]MCQ8781828.1 enoyl-CoA hydratase/isomerase family protein [Aurantimonas sp. CSK15Z-1]